VKYPTVGVVIPCHNNSRQLYGVLQCLHHQTVPPDAIVAVDDTSSSWQETRLRALCRLFRVQYRHLGRPRNCFEALGRRSHARNVGTRCLNTDVVLYLDGDMLLDPEYVEEIKFYHRILPDVYIRGRRFSIPTTFQATGMQACAVAVRERQLQPNISPVEYAVYDESFEWQKVFGQAYRDKWEWCASNNLSVRRDCVVRIGLWDENFLGWGEEDMDFSFRLCRYGLKPISLLSRAAAAYHLEHEINHEVNTLTLRRNAGYLLDKFPEVAPYRREAYAKYKVSVGVEYI
jgi:glycosyltransferase involved in cell wall biosynthesis